jgi:predicted RNA binding protein YcfA (HicA-like mRNA interferase family)
MNSDHQEMVYIKLNPTATLSRSGGLAWRSAQIDAMKKRKLLQKLITNQKNIRFADAVTCAESFGFRLDRVNGSHHIFIHPDIPELLNLQDVKGKAKPYQIRQMLQLIEAHNLRMDE